MASSVASQSTIFSVSSATTSTRSGGRVARHPVYLNLAVWEGADLGFADPTLHVDFAGSVMVCKPKQVKNGNTLVFDADNHFPLPALKKRGQYAGPTEFAIRVYNGTDLVGRVHADFGRVRKGMPRSWWLPVERALQEFAGGLHVGLLLSYRPEPVPRQAQSPPTPSPGTPAAPRASTPARVAASPARSSAPGALPVPATSWIEVSPTAGPKPITTPSCTTARQAAERARAIASGLVEAAPVRAKDGPDGAVWGLGTPSRDGGRSEFESPGPRLSIGSRSEKVAPYAYDEPEEVVPPPAPRVEESSLGFLMGCFTCFSRRETAAQDLEEPSDAFVQNQRNISLWQRLSS
eukprot:tig00020553_g10547.t2